MATIDVVSQKPLDGISVKPILLDTRSKWTPRTIVSSWNGKTRIRSRRYHLDHSGRLYDLQVDPGRRKDMAEKNQVIVNQLTNLLSDWKKDVRSEIIPDDRPFTVGNREFPTTHLPARDGIPHGNIERTGKAPNCSYFTNWTSNSDSITWDIDVATSARYEATGYYTCAAADVGSVSELVFGDPRITDNVTEAHDPPLVGAEQDSLSRGAESLVNDFKPLRLGEIEYRKDRVNSSSVLSKSKGNR